ncbi:hypothetical protein TWF696_009480 [Orbilia brochopaga]|uniref:Uncharacterized protein n=1 Tax=Orbilia brochopaga TaxID=3140254 RepID=A0AAV9UE93_9PEZI
MADEGIELVQMNPAATSAASAASPPPHPSSSANPPPPPAGEKISLTYVYPRFAIKNRDMAEKTVEIDPTELLKPAPENAEPSAESQVDRAYIALFKREQGTIDWMLYDFRVVALHLKNGGIESIDLPLARGNPTLNIDQAMRSNNVSKIRITIAYRAVYKAFPSFVAVLLGTVGGILRFSGHISDGAVIAFLIVALAAGFANLWIGSLTGR